MTLTNSVPVRAALKALHDNLIDVGTELSLLQADVAFLMATADTLGVVIDYSGLCSAIVDGDYVCLDRLRSLLSREIAGKRGDKAGEIGAPW